MIQGINLGYVMLRREGEKRTLEQAAKMCKASGFTEVDYLTPLDGDDYEEQARKARSVLDSLEIKVQQTHCPFFRYADDGPKKFAVQGLRAAKASAILGAKHMVLHGDEWPAKGEAYSIRKAIPKNYELMAPVVEACLNGGVHPAFENLFDDPARQDDHGRTRCCALAEEVLTLVSMFKDERVGVCLDTGHGHVEHKEQVMGFMKCIAPYVTCTHIHDNKGHEDSHLPAFLGTLKLEEIMQILKANGYKGIFTWEMVYGRYPDELMPSFLTFLKQCGDYLCNFLY